MTKGLIVLLNGVSSSGKTTIAAEMLNMLNTFFHLSVDEYAYYIEKMETREHPRIIPIETEYLFHNTVKLFSDNQVNIIVDHILHNHFTKSNWFEIFKDYPVFYVGVKCSLLDLEKRERERGDRNIGQGKMQLDFTHKDMKYDIEIDTSTVLPFENVMNITELMRLRYGKYMSN